MLAAARQAAIEALEAGETSTGFACVTAANAALAEGLWRGTGGVAAAGGNSAGGNEADADGADAADGADGADGAEAVVFEVDEAEMILTVRQTTHEAVMKEVLG